ncbi:MAG: hypothetical protein IKM29_03125 [Clostridia bacterium]|nr:hypothetical protein [Clostridia bacterium]
MGLEFLLAGEFVFIIWILIILFFAAIAFGIIYLLLLVASSSVVFSKVTFCLITALIASYESRLEFVPDRPFLNFLAWITVIGLVIYLVSMLPKVNDALRVTSTLLASGIIVGFVARLTFEIINGIVDKEIKYGIFMEVSVRIICIIIAVVMTILKKAQSENVSDIKPLMRLLDRSIASVLYGFATACCCTSFASSWEFPDYVYYLIIVACSIVAFLIDFFMEKKNIRILKGKK